jgi:hypothetical protein
MNPVATALIRAITQLETAQKACGPTSAAPDLQASSTIVGAIQTLLQPLSVLLATP